MARCGSCGAEVSVFRMKNGFCPQCREIFVADSDRKAVATVSGSVADRAAHQAPSAHIILTTETSHNLPVTERLGIITAECVVGMNVFRDIAASARDLFGGRSETMQKGLRQAREAALSELREEALTLGADAVVGVDLDYSEISGSGKSMLFLVASGTAVKLADDRKSVACSG